MSLMEFETTNIRMNRPQAKRILKLINEYQDFSNLTVGDVLDLNKITAQLEEFINE